MSGVTIVAPANVSLTGLAATGQVGAVSVDLFIDVSVTGVSATSAVGAVTLATETVVNLVGVSAIGEVGRLLIWENILPNQNPHWIDVIT